METRKRVLGTEHPDTLESMTNLAFTYTSQGRLKEAESLHAQIAQMKEKRHEGESAHASYMTKTSLFTPSTDI
jgi:YD repeat-containing protein